MPTAELAVWRLRRSSACADYDANCVISTGPNPFRLVGEPLLAGERANWLPGWLPAVPYRRFTSRSYAF